MCYCGGATDTAAVTDSVATEMVFARTISDSIAVADAGVDTEVVFERSASDTLAATDTASAGMQVEANVDDANWYVGFSDNVAADFMQDNGAGPAANYDGIGFFKVDGTMQIQFETSNAATQETTAALSTFTSGVWYTLGFTALTLAATDTTVPIVPYCYNHTTGAETIGTAHTLTIAGLAEMHLIAGLAKAGGANGEQFNVDYTWAAQVR